MNCGVVHEHATLGHHLLQVAKAQRIGGVPAHAREHDIKPEVQPLDHLTRGRPGQLYVQRNHATILACGLTATDPSLFPHPSVVQNVMLAPADEARSIAKWNGYPAENSLFFRHRLGKNSAMTENFTINPAPPAPDCALLHPFQQVPTSHISDNLRRLEGIVGLKRFNPTRKLIGTAVTVKARAGDNLLTYKALSMMSPGHILVVDAGGMTSNAIVGDLLLAYAQQRGCAGFVVDGAIRDSAAFAAADFPCYARDVTHRGPFKTGPGSVNVPVSIGGQVVQPGDVMVGDEDGIVVFPYAEVTRLLDAALKSAAAERAIREEILTGNIRQSWMDKMFAVHGL